MLDFVSNSLATWAKDTTLKLTWTKLPFVPLHCSIVLGQKHPLNVKPEVSIKWHVCMEHCKPWVFSINLHGQYSSTHICPSLIFPHGPKGIVNWAWVPHQRKFNWKGITGISLFDVSVLKELVFFIYLQSFVYLPRVSRLSDVPSMVTLWSGDHLSAFLFLETERYGWDSGDKAEWSAVQWVS